MSLRIERRDDQNEEGGAEGDEDECGQHEELP
jgi:hypothetical protein